MKDIFWTKEEILKATEKAHSITKILKKLKSPTNAFNRLRLIHHLRIYEINTAQLRFGSFFQRGPQAHDLETAEELTRETFKKQRENNSRKKRDSRKTKDPEKLSSVLLEDFLKGDRKKNLVNDLDLQFIFSLISQGCLYCGEKDLRMTLDRIDNSLGHTKNNVNPACCRCNSIRQNMPYAAWLFLVPRIREAREAGVFGHWIGVFNKPKATAYSHQTPFKS